MDRSSGQVRHRSALLRRQSTLRRVLGLARRQLRRHRCAPLRRERLLYRTSALGGGTVRQRRSRRHTGVRARNPNFRLERSWGLEATLHAHSASVNFDASAYYNWITNFIYEKQVGQGVCEAAAVRYGAAGREVDPPCFQYNQADAHYHGFEADLSANLFTLGTTRINADVLGYYVHANVVDQGPVPRIPAPRVLGGIEAQGDALTARAEVEHLFEQNRTAAFETATSDYTLVNASLASSPFGQANKTQLVLSANNIFDVNARRASSFLKDFAPLAGRDLRATLRFGL